jgi:RNA polymerase sigma factor (sigma-70 family)
VTKAGPLFPYMETTITLLERVRAGDPDALEQLITRCLPRLQRWAQGRLPQSARGLVDTQDLVQDTILSSLRQLRRFEVRGEGALHAYLRQALLNRVRDEIRRGTRRGIHVELESGIPAAGVSPLEQAIGRDAIERYERALTRLRPTDREAIILRLEFGYSYEQVMHALEKPSVPTTRKAVERAVLRLASEMDADRNRRVRPESPGA